MGKVQVPTEELLECDGCGRLEKMFQVTRNWMTIRPYRHGPTGGGPIEIGDQPDEFILEIVTCSMACLRKAMRTKILPELDDWMMSR